MSDRPRLWVFYSLMVVLSPFILVWAIYSIITAFIRMGVDVIKDRK